MSYLRKAITMYGSDIVVVNGVHPLLCSNKEKELHMKMVKTDRHGRNEEQ